MNFERIFVVGRFDCSEMVLMSPEVHRSTIKISYANTTNQTILATHYREAEVVPSDAATRVCNAFEWVAPPRGTLPATL